MELVRTTNFGIYQGGESVSRTEFLRKSLVKANIKPSYPRMRILDYLLSVKTHPTAEEVFDELVKEMPTLSRTTVHNTLNLFADAKLARVVTIDGHQRRFDGTTELHGHFRCRECGKVFDFAVDGGSIRVSGLEEFQVDEQDVYFRGLCRECLMKVGGKQDGGLMEGATWRTN